MSGIYSQLAQLIGDNRAAAMATVVHGERLGAKMLMSAEGIIVGGIQPDVDATITADALEMLSNEVSETRTYNVKAVRSEAKGVRTGELGPHSSIDVFIETFPPPQRLVIIGAVHIAIPLHRLAKMLGYHVTVVDTRGVLATPERFPMADSILVQWPDDALAALGLNSSTSAVVLTHDPKFDYPALMAAINSPVRYIGAIGSRTTNRQRVEALRDLGATEEQLARIFAPVGLDIGAKTPAEIALAVMGEIVAARRGRPGGHLRARNTSAEF